MKLLIFISFFFFCSLVKGADSELCHESENFFNSFLFVEYHEQLKQFAQGATCSSEAQFVDFIRSYQPGNADQNRAFYYAMIDNLRALIKSGNQNTDFIDRFTVGLFESVNMWDSLVRLQNDRYTSENTYPGLMTPFDLIAYTKEVYALTLNDPSLNGCDKISKETNDQMRFGNFPYALFHLDKTLVLRIPSITKEVSSQVEIVEEFAQYLHALQRKNKKHLYVNLITQKYGKGISNDPEFRKQVERLEQIPELQGTIFTVTLDKNSPFYFQSDEYEQMEDAEEFINTFAGQLFSTSNPKYYWPSSLDAKEWQNTCLDLLREIHTACYNGQATLTVEERKDFIHIAYIEIVKKLVKHLKVDSMNVSCVNTVDRGISLLSELYLDQLFQQGAMIAKEDAERFTSLVLIHPIVLRNRPAHIYRLDRILSATRQMHQLNSPQKLYPAFRDY